MNESIGIRQSPRTASESPVECLALNLNRGHNGAGGAAGSVAATIPFPHRKVVIGPPARQDQSSDPSIALLAHELRSPLAAIGYAAKVLEATAADAATVARMGALIRRQAQQMSQLVDELMKSARILNHPLVLLPQRVDLREVLRHAIETTESDVAQRGHCLSVACPSEAVWLQGDPVRLEQIFVNLLSNAAKYTDVGGSIAVDLRKRTGRCIVRVRDSGIGIEAKALAHVFEPFRQVNPTHASSQAGLGVGLGWVRQLVELHGGSVSAASDGLGRGSTFRVVLPAGTPAGVLRAGPALIPGSTGPSARR